MASSQLHLWEHDARGRFEVPDEFLKHHALAAVVTDALQWLGGAEGRLDEVKKGPIKMTVEKHHLVDFQRSKESKR